LVLVIEDEAILAEAIGIYLQRRAYDIVVACTGEEGLRLAEQAGPDVALVDIKLPGIDGIEVLRRVRKVSPRTTVIMMTAHDASIYSMEVAALGAFDCLQKPLDLEELRSAVGRALEGRHTNSSSI
jgi:two-component system response regulator AtoC